MSVVNLFPPRQAATRSHGWLHVTRHADGKLAVEHESASGELWGMIATFEQDQLEQAVRCALNILPDFGSTRLGHVALPLEFEPGGKAA